MLMMRRCLQAQMIRDVSFAAAADDLRLFTLPLDAAATMLSRHVTPCRAASAAIVSDAAKMFVCALAF